MAAQDAASIITELLGKEAVGGSFSDFLSSLGIGEEGAQGGGGDLSSLLGMLGGPPGEQDNAGRQNGTGNFSSDSGPSRPDENGFMDPRLLGLMTRAMTALKADDPNIDLLRALKPYLAPSRQEKVDQAIKVMRLLKLLPILRESGMLGILD